MKKIFILFVAALSLGVSSVVAQSRTSYFMEGSVFRTELNPALTTTRGYFKIPAIGAVGVDLTNNFLSVDNFIYQRDGQLVTALHGSVTADEFLGRLPDINRLNANVTANILGVGFYTGKVFWNIGLNSRVNADVNLSKDLFSVLKTLGNDTYDLKDTSISMQAYLETYLGSSFRVCDWINVGLRLKFLIGLVDAHTEIGVMQANVTPDNVSAQLRGTVRGNAIFVDQDKIKSGEVIDAEMFNFANATEMLKSVKSYGVALDLGAEFRLLNDHLKLSAAVTDLGVIKWAADNHIMASATGDFNFSGYEILPKDAEEGEQIFDSNFEFVMGDKPAKGYTTKLTFGANLAAEYNFLRNHMSVGLLAHSRFNGGYLYTELTTSLNLRPLNWITATVSHTFFNHQKPGVFGAALNIHPKGINFFVGLDYIGSKWVMWDDTIKIPYDMKSVNLYVGLSSNFARPKFMRAEQIAKKQARKEAKRAERMAK